MSCVRWDLPEKEGDRCLTLTAAVIQHFHTEAAMFGRYQWDDRDRGATSVAAAS